MTQDADTETVRAVSAIVMKVSTLPLADGTTRAVIPMSIPVNEDTLPIITKLMLAVKKTVSLGIIFDAIQGVLDFAETAEAATTLMDHAAAQGVTLTQIVGADGSTYLAHRFAESKGDRDKCAICDAGASHEIHSAEALNVRQKMREEQDALIKAGQNPAPTGNDTADALIEEAAETPDKPRNTRSRREPADQTEAETQAQAEANLRSKAEEAAA